MAYVPNEWQDRIGTGLNNFTDQNGNELTLTPNPTSITQAGTPFSAEWMNHIEQGISTLDRFFSSIDPVIKKAARAKLGMGKLLWSGKWSTSGGAPASIPGISQYSLLLVSVAANPVLCAFDYTRPTVPCFVGKGPNASFTNSTTSMVERAVRISLGSGDAISGLRILDYTYFGGSGGQVSIAASTAVVDAVYGLI